MQEKANVKESILSEAEKWAQEAKTALTAINFKNEENKSLLAQLAEFSVRRAF